MKKATNVSKYGYHLKGDAKILFNNMIVMYVTLSNTAIQLGYSRQQVYYWLDTGYISTGAQYVLKEKIGKAKLKRLLYGCKFETI